MKLTRHQRISGKARRVYHRERELRQLAHKNIDEYLYHNEADDDGERHVPVVRGGPALAEIGTVAVDPYTRRKRQPDLPSAAQAGPETAVVNQVASHPQRSRVDTNEPDRLIAGAAPLQPPPQTDQPAPVLAVHHAKTPKLDAKHRPLQPTARGRLSLAGIMLGCAAGTAAAVVILTVVKTLVG